MAWSEAATSQGTTRSWERDLEPPIIFRGSAANTLALDLQTLELGENKHFLFKPPSLWESVKEALKSSCYMSTCGVHSFFLIQKR